MWCTEQACIIISLLEFVEQSKFYFLLVAPLWKLETASVTCSYAAVEPPIKDPLRKGQPPYKGHSSRSLYHSINTFLTSEKRTTSEIRTEAVSPKCPLFRGSAVYQDFKWSQGMRPIGDTWRSACIFQMIIHSHPIVDTERPKEATMMTIDNSMEATSTSTDTLTTKSKWL